MDWQITMRLRNKDNTMKKEIHPAWFPEASVVCACGNTWTTGAAVAEIRTDICSACHPFFTGEQRIVDTEGRVDRFMSRLRQRDQMRAQVVEREAAKTPLTLPIEELGLNKRTLNVLAANEIHVVQDFLTKFEEVGDDGILAFNGIGRQALAEIKKSLRNAGYDLPEQEEAEA
jgi:large subunit ribosomal protein L31